MPKLRCPCGFVHDLSPIPDDGWLTIADVDYEKVVNAEICRGGTNKARRPNNVTPDISEYDKAVVDNTGLLYECLSCGRLMWQKPSSKKYRVFLPDTTPQK